MQGPTSPHVQNRLLSNMLFHGSMQTAIVRLVDWFLNFWSQNVWSFEGQMVFFNVVFFPWSSDGCNQVRGCDFWCLQHMVIAKSSVFQVKLTLRKSNMQWTMPHSERIFLVVSLYFFFRAFPTFTPLGQVTHVAPAPSRPVAAVAAVTASCEPASLVEGR